MTARLRHSLAGYQRLIQISQAQIVAIVEGRIDRFFYHEICTVAFENYDVRYDVRMVSELPVSTGGKPGALEFYDALRTRKSLVDDFKGKRSVVIFFLDKDVDDLLRAKRRSEHVIYTEVYEVENYLFLYGDVSRALAAALKLPRIWVEPLLPENWTVVAAEAWKDWIVLCFIAQMLRVSAPSNYGVASKINVPCTAPSDVAEFSARLADLSVRSGLASHEFDAVAARARRTVDRLYSAGRHDAAFRGKWYLKFLHYWTLSSGSAFGDDELISAVLTTLDFHDVWSAHFAKSIQGVARAAQLITT